jgi:hypothetical protein
LFLFVCQNVTSYELQIKTKIMKAETKIFAARAAPKRQDKRPTGSGEEWAAIQGCDVAMPNKLDYNRYPGLLPVPVLGI